MCINVNAFLCVAASGHGKRKYSKVDFYGVKQCVEHIRE